MKKLIMLATTMLLILAACVEPSTVLPADAEVIEPTTEISTNLEESPTPAVQDSPTQHPATHPTEDPTSGATTPLPTYTTPTWTISEYGRQAAEDFLFTMTTIFTDVLHAEVEYVDGNRVRPAERFRVGWDLETHEAIMTDIIPEFYIDFMESGVWNSMAFFDRHHNRVYDAPWLEVNRGDDWTSYRYANHFRLFDFDNDGIPEILIHYRQTFDGGYAGAYHIFRYVDGAYRRLEQVLIENGEAHNWPWAWISSAHTLFWDSNGKIISFIDSMYHGVNRYEHLVLTNEHAEFHVLASLDWQSNWEAWEAHHWYEWNEPRDSWMNHSPTIFGTNISLTPIESMTELEDEITRSIMSRKRG